MAKSITYNSQSLQDSYILTKDIIYRNVPNKSLDIEPYSRRSGFRLVNSYYNYKDITVAGTISRDTEANLKTTIDSLKLSLNADEGNLDIGDGSTTIRFNASVIAFEIPEEHYNITNVPFKIVFRCQPFGKSTTLTSDSQTISTASYSNTLTGIGSAEFYPVIRFICAGVPTAAITQIRFTNTDTSASNTTSIIQVNNLTLNNTNEYLEINTENMTVKVYDGSTLTEVDYTGVFPIFGPGTNTYSVNVTCSGSFSLTQSIQYYAKYL